MYVSNLISCLVFSVKGTWNYWWVLISTVFCFAFLSLCILLTLWSVKFSALTPVPRTFNLELPLMAYKLVLSPLPGGTALSWVGCAVVILFSLAIPVILQVPVGICTRWWLLSAFVVSLLCLSGMALMKDSDLTICGVNHPCFPKDIEVFYSQSKQFHSYFSSM